MAGTRLNFILMMAQQGLGVAAKILRVQKASLLAEAQSTLDIKKKTELEESAKKYELLADVLEAADTGISQFITQS